MTIRRKLRQPSVVHAQPFELEPAVAHAVADRLGDRLGLLVDLLQHERLEAALLGALVVPVELDELALDGGAVGRAQELRRAARIATMSPSSGKYTSRVSRRNAAAFEARNVSPVTDPDHERRTDAARPRAGRDGHGG